MTNQELIKIRFQAPCLACHGTGECEGCKGAGELPKCGHHGTRIKCDDCLATGECDECDGTGKRRPRWLREIANGNTHPELEACARDLLRLERQADELNRLMPRKDYQIRRELHAACMKVHRKAQELMEFHS